MMNLLKSKDFGIITNSLIDSICEQGMGFIEDEIFEQKEIDDFWKNDYPRLQNACPHIDDLLEGYSCMEDAEINGQDFIIMAYGDFINLFE